MRTSLKTCNAILLVLICTFAAAPAWSTGTAEFTKEVEREFPISRSGNVDINNSYGNIDIQTWDKQAVKFEITITVDAGNSSDAQKFFDRVEIHFANSPSNVSAITEILPSKSWKSWLFGDNLADAFSIEYKVTLPASVRLDVSNKYGDLYIASMTNDLDLNIRYGSMRLEGTTGDVDLVLSNGKGSIGKVKSLDADVSYSSLRISTAEEIDIASRYSRIEIDKAGAIGAETKYDTYRINSAGQLSNNGRYDDFFIESISSIDMESKYTNIVVEHLYEEADVNLSNGSIKLKNVHKGFSDIEMECSYAPIEIGMTPGTAFTYDVYSNYGDVKINQTEALTTIENVAKNEYTGYRGSKDAPAVIRITMSYGALVLE